MSASVLREVWEQGRLSDVESSFVPHEDGILLSFSNILLDVFFDCHAGQKTVPVFLLHL